MDGVSHVNRANATFIRTTWLEEIVQKCTLCQVIERFELHGLRKRSRLARRYSFRERHLLQCQLKILDCGNDIDRVKDVDSADCFDR